MKCMYIHQVNVNLDAVEFLSIRQRSRNLNNFQKEMYISVEAWRIPMCILIELRKIKK